MTFVSAASDIQARATRTVGLALVLAACLLLSTGVARAQESYTFMGLAWGSGPAEARAHLEQRGFQFDGDTVSGPTREFHMDRAIGVFQEYDRGLRLVGTGRMAGQKVHVQLIFGDNEQLDHVIVQSERWKGTLDHAREITNLARILTDQYEEQYGPAQRNEIHGYVDTAIWRPADDGTRLNLYIRGTNGYMFYPGDDTMLRVHFENPAYKSDDEPVTTIVNLRTFSRGVDTASTAEQEVSPEEMERRLREMYRNDGLQ